MLGTLETLGPALLEADVEPPAVDGNSVPGVSVGREVDVDVKKMVVPLCEVVRTMVVILLVGVSAVVCGGGRVVAVVAGGVEVVGAVVGGAVDVVEVIGGVWLVVGRGSVVDGSSVVGGDEGDVSGTVVLVDIFAMQNR